MTNNKHIIKHNLFHCISLSTDCFNLSSPAVIPQLSGLEQLGQCGLPDAGLIVYQYSLFALFRTQGFVCINNPSALGSYFLQPS